MTTKMTAAQAAQQKNRSGAGQYQAKLNAERAGGLDQPSDTVVMAAFGAPEDHYEQFFQEHPEVPRGKARLLLHNFSDHVAQYPDSAWRDTLARQLSEAAKPLPENLVMGPDRGQGQAYDDAQSALRMVSYTWDRLQQERERAAEDLVIAAGDDESKQAQANALRLAPQDLGLALREAAEGNPELSARRERLQQLVDDHNDYLERERLAFHDALPHLSVEDADTAYEELARRFLENPDSEDVPNELDRLAQQNAQAAGIQFDPTYRPPGARRGPGYTQGGAVVGEHYTGHMDITEINKLARKEFKAAQDAGWLPPGLNISVRGRKFAGGQAMDVTVKGLTEADVHETDHDGERRWTPQARELRDRLETIADAWNRNDTDSQIDYFDTEYYSHVDLDIY